MWWRTFKSTLLELVYSPLTNVSSIFTRLFGPTTKTVHVWCLVLGRKHRVGSSEHHQWKDLTKPDPQSWQRALMRVVFGTQANCYVLWVWGRVREKSQQTFDKKSCFKDQKRAALLTARYSCCHIGTGPPSLADLQPPTAEYPCITEVRTMPRRLQA